MKSVGLDVSQHLRRDKLSIYSVPEATEGEKSEALLNQLSQSIEQLSRGAQFIALRHLCSPTWECGERCRRRRDQIREGVRRCRPDYFFGISLTV